VTIASGRSTGLPPPSAPPLSQPQGTFDWTQGAVRVGGAIADRAKVKEVAPVYPPIAQSARIQGIVIIEARVEPDGHVSNARVVEGIPLLDQEAIDAAVQWEFTPTVLNGKPVPVLVTIAVQFTLKF